MNTAREILHYAGSDDDRGGIMSVVKALATTERFICVLGVNPGFVQRRAPTLPTLELPAIAGEMISLGTFWRARAVARAVRAWLAADERRVFHGQSRAGLLVGLWLVWQGEKRVVVSVHCYGRQRWFYRWAAGVLGPRLYWLTPAMKRYYGVEGEGWGQCIPGCVSEDRLQMGSRGRYAGEGVLRLGGVGALVRWKGWHHVVEALALVPAERRARISFQHIGGAGGSREEQAYAAELRARTSALGLEKTVTWLGERASADAFLGRIDCLVVASEREPFSVAMLEALAAGLPVLAADSGGARDVIEPGKTGWFFRTGEAADLARAMVELTSEAAWSQRAVGAPEILRTFTAPVVAERWAQVYAAL